jgi:hypothetical protein
MPVHVAVSLLAAEAEHVQSLGRDGAAERAANAVDHALQREVLILGEVVDDALAVLRRRHEHLAVQRLKAL